MLQGVWKEKREEKVGPNSYSEECDMAYRYRVEPSIPNREAIIKTLKKKGFIKMNKTETVLFIIRKNLCEK